MLRKVYILQSGCIDTRHLGKRESAVAAASRVKRRSQTRSSRSAQSTYFTGLVAMKNDRRCATAALHHERVPEGRPQTDWFVPPDGERQLTGLRRDGERAPRLATLIVSRESRQLRIRWMRRFDALVNDVAIRRHLAKTRHPGKETYSGRRKIRRRRQASMPHDRTSACRLSRGARRPCYRAPCDTFQPAFRAWPVPLRRA